MIRVLIADSDAAAREDLRARLAAEPDVEIVGLARDGQEAVQMAHALRPDVALLAAALAVCDGYQTAQYIVGGRPADRQHPACGRTAGRTTCGTPCGRGRANFWTGPLRRRGSARPFAPSMRNSSGALRRPSPRPPTRRR